jgi:hypothetical protein
MRNWGLILVGGAIIFFGVAALASTLFDINLWLVCGPMLLILLGVGLLVGPSIGFPGENTRILPIGEIRRRENWQVGSEDIWMFVGDLRLDFTQAELPPGGATLRLLAFVNDARLVLPPELEYRIESTGFLTTARIFGVKRDIFATTLREESPGYASAEQHVRIEFFAFVNDIKIKAGETANPTEASS